MYIYIGRTISNLNMFITFICLYSALNSNKSGFEVKFHTEEIFNMDLFGRGDLLEFFFFRIGAFYLALAEIEVIVYIMNNANFGLIYALKI